MEQGGALAREDLGPRWARRCRRPLRILLTSFSFWPSVGGLEVASALLADGLHRWGADVTVLTATPCGETGACPYQVIREPSLPVIWRWSDWADLILQNHPSLRLGWPLLVRAKPTIIAVQTWVGFSGWEGWLRSRLLQRADACIGVSRAIAEHLPVEAAVIPNPYDETIFRCKGDEVRTKDIAFVGRMVPEKGVLDLIEAISLLKRQGMTLSATLVGDGPERVAAKKRARELGVLDQLDFLGIREPVEVASLLREHRVLAVPSVWEEPFGIVALEGIACGCVVVGSERGGLKEAIGPCGLSYANGDAFGLARRLGELLPNPKRLLFLRKGAEEHLHKFRSATVLQGYLDVIGKVLSET